MRLHTGGWTHRTDESPQHFDSETLSQLVLVLRMGFEPLVFGSGVDALPIEPPRHPVSLLHKSCETERKAIGIPQRRACERQRQTHRETQQAQIKIVPSSGHGANSACLFLPNIGVFSFCVFLSHFLFCFHWLYVNH